MNKPMLSIKSVYTEDAVVQWLSKALTHIPGMVVRIEPKLDGVACSLTYTDGVLTGARTRGDGLVGQDILDTVRFANGVLPKLPTTHRNWWTGEIRGEIVLPHDRIPSLNNNYATSYKSPRHGAAGIVNTKNPPEYLARQLFFVPYDIVTESFPFDTNDLHDMGFYLLPECTTISSVLPSFKARVLTTLSGCSKMMACKAAGYWPIDGFVVRILSELPEAVLNNTKSIRGDCLAFKLSGLRYPSKVLSIDFQVGEMGKVTPIANIEPITIDNTQVSRVNLHNKEKMARLGIQVGSEVMVSLQAGIIPTITLPEPKEINLSWLNLGLK